MTEVFGLAVRFRAPGESTFTTQVVDTGEEQAELTGRLRSEGFEAVPVALTWQVVPEPTSGENAS